MRKIVLHTTSIGQPRYFPGRAAAADPSIGKSREIMYINALFYAKKVFFV
jgi:hypothetical protein